MGWRRAAGAVAMLAAMWATPAAAQSPSYGGGRLPSAAVPKRGYIPTLGIVLQPRGGQIAMRFDTSLRCGGTSYDTVGRAVVPFDGRSFSAGAARRFRIGGGRVVFAWTLAGQADGTIASGTLRLTGTRTVNGRRTACNRKPTRRFSARLAGPAPAGSPSPPARASFGGLSAIRVADGLRGPVVLKVTGSGRRIAARWTALASCRRGPRADLVNFTPSMRIRPDGTFGRSERFRVAYTDAVVRYRVSFAGRISGEGAAGRLRMRARIFDRSGRRLVTRCDSRTRSWTAALLRPIAPAPGGTAPTPPPGSTSPTPTPTPEPRSPVPGEWSLNMTSDPGDYIGQGRTWSHAPPADSVRVSAGRQLISLHVDTADQTNGGWWDTEFAAPPGQNLAVGTYENARRYPFNDDAPGFAHGGMGRGCNTLTARFTIHELAYDPDGTLRTFRADFEQHCEGGVPALRGTWVFNAA